MNPLSISIKNQSRAGAWLVLWNSSSICSIVLCPMRKEAIISALWPEADEQTLRTYYSTIYYLRQALGGESVIVAKGGTYALRLDALYGKKVWYDVAAFEAFEARAKQALSDGHYAGSQRGLSAMVDLYRGDYIQPFYSDWCSRAATSYEAPIWKPITSLR